MSFYRLPRPRTAAWLASALLAVAASAAQAQTFNFNFSANGFGIVGACAGAAPDCLDGFTVGDAQDVGGPAFPIPGSWAQYLSFTLAPSSGAVAGTWSLMDNDDSLNDLSGTFTGLWLAGAGGSAQVSLSYVVTDGGGQFTGATGGGQSLLLIDGDFNYIETGTFSVSAVPEPAAPALFLLGAGALAALARRRGGFGAGAASRPSTGCR